MALPDSSDEPFALNAPQMEPNIPAQVAWASRTPARLPRANERKCSGSQLTGWSERACVRVHIRGHIVSRSARLPKLAALFYTPHVQLLV